MSKDTDKPKRIAEQGKRHRRDNGPAALEVKPVPRPSLASQGTLHVHTEALIQGGAVALLADNRRAKLIAQEHGEVFGEALMRQWTWETKWVQELRATHRGRTQADYAMQWRPVFLATVALAHSTMIGAKAAHVADNTVLAHREADPDFDAQVIAAQAHCIELLHAVTMRDAVEGVLEPIFWQGIEVGHVRKVDNRLRIDMLRAHMPAVFKTPGSKININSGQQFIANGKVIFDTPVMTQLQEMRAESLRRLEEKRAKAVEVGTPALPPVPPAT